MLEEKFRLLYKKDPVARKIHETAVQLEQELLANSTSRAMYEDGATLRLRIAALLRQRLDREVQAKQQEQRAAEARKQQLYEQQQLGEQRAAAAAAGAGAGAAGGGGGEPRRRQELLLVALLLAAAYAAAWGALRAQALLRLVRALRAGAAAAPRQLLRRLWARAGSGRERPQGRAKQEQAQQAHGHPGVLHSRAKGPTRRQSSSSGASRRSAAGATLRQESPLSRAGPAGAGAQLSPRQPARSSQAQQIQQHVAVALRQEQQQRQEPQRQEPQRQEPQRQQQRDQQRDQQRRQQPQQQHQQEHPALGGAAPPQAAAAAAAAAAAELAEPRAAQAPADAAAPRSSAAAPEAQLEGALPLTAVAAKLSADGAAASPAAGGAGGGGGDDDDECTLCLEGPRQSILAPCGHCALCADCTAKLFGPPGDVSPAASCPICCQRVCSYVCKVYLA